MFTLYVNNNSLNIETVVDALPQIYPVRIIEKWNVEKVFQVPSNDEKSNKTTTKKTTSYHGVLLVDQKSINPLKTYVKVQVHKNIYPREFEDGKKLFFRMKPLEKKRIDELFKLFSKASEKNEPVYIPKNGYGFYQFESEDIVPVVLGMLRNYPEIKDATMKYARL